jgi:hypothetical protein
MAFTDKIHAIKFLREMVINSILSLEPKVEKGENTGTFSITMTKPYIGLKDAKDFVEAVMELNPAPRYVYELTRISVLDGKQPIPHERVGLYRTYARAVDVRDNVMRHRTYNDCWETSEDFSIVEVELT